MDNNNFNAHNININNQNDMPNKNTATAKDRNSSNLLVGVICGIFGLIIGGALVFGISQFTKSSDSKCSDCDCKQCENKNTTSENLTTSFLTLEPDGQNIIYSPLSIKYGLSLLGAGASGATKAQIEGLLGNEELPRYENVANTLSLANAVFVRDTFAKDVLPSYTETVQEKYNSEILYDDFTGSANMDKWVDQKTFGLINNIGIQPNDGTKMVLANALAIQMDWVHEFNKESTYGKTFYNKDGEEIEATTMFQKTYADDVKYYTDNDITMLSMPLQETPAGTKLDFVAVMPSSDLASYVGNLNIDAINTMVNDSTPASEPTDGVEIYIPKFKFDYQLNFKQDLQDLGINQAFTPSTADFSAMASERLYVNDAIHKANIDFSEEGIKAAAITVFVMDVDIAAMQADDIPKPVVIKIDHPFLFLIRDRDNGAVWFIGTVYEPRLWQDDSAEYRREFGY